MHIQRSKVYYNPAERSVDEQLRQESIMARIDHWHTQMPGIGTRKLVSVIAFADSAMLK